MTREMTQATFAELQSIIASLTERPTAFVLGSGMGPILARVNSECAVGFHEIPGMVAPTVAGHGGSLVFGNWANRPVLVFLGRLHFYEGHDWARVTRPMDVLRELDAKCVVLTNASGGIAENLEPGSLMTLTDHLQWNAPKSWTIPQPGSRPAPYSPKLNDELSAASKRAKVSLARGIYAVVTGPVYETPAEIRALKSLGADAVGMSTVMESLRAAEIGLPVAAISCVANRAAGLSDTPLSHREVLEAVAGCAEKLGRLLEEFVRG